MKKCVCFLMVLLMIVGTAAAEGMAGGWTVNGTPETIEDGGAFDKAMEGFAGVRYTPVALLATQVVAGINYCYLCESTTVTAEPEKGYALVYVYADLEGNAAVARIADVEFAIEGEEESPFEWEVCENALEIPEEAAAAFAGAMEGLTGVGYEAKACLAVRETAGFTYCFLCKAATVTAQPVEGYAFVYVLAGQDGTLRCEDIRNVEFSLYEEEE